MNCSSLIFYSTLLFQSDDDYEDANNSSVTNSTCLDAVTSIPKVKQRRLVKKKKREQFSGKNCIKRAEETNTCTEGTKNCSILNSNNSSFVFDETFTENDTIEPKSEEGVKVRLFHFHDFLFL